MTTQTVTVLEGTWEEIMEHADELAGKRLVVTVLADKSASQPSTDDLRPENRRMLEVLEEMRNTPLSAEEEAAFEEWERNRDAYRLRFRPPEAFE